MVEVLSKGKRKKLRCPYCESLLRYSLEDIHRAENLFNEYIECPICEREIFIYRLTRR